MADGRNAAKRHAICLSLLLLTTLVLATAGIVHSARGDRSDAPRDISPAIAAVREKFDAPGVAAAVVQNGKIIAIGASGTRGIDDLAPAGIDDRSMIGSCGKALTRLLIARLVDGGKLRFDSTLGELLPDVSMREEYRDVTLADLMAHRGGIQPYTEIGPRITPELFERTGTPREQRATFIRHLLKQTPAAPPRSKMVYSNAGFGLLGHIAERTADKPYEDLMNDEVFKPLGMTTAIVGSPLADPAFPGWQGHRKTPKGFRTAPARPGLAPIAPAGLISCSIVDFAKFAAAQCRVAGGQAVSGFLSELTAQILRAATVDESSKEGEIFFGGDGHYTAAYAVWPSKDMAIVVASNAGDSDDLCTGLLEAARNSAAPELSSLDRGAPPNDGKLGILLEVNDGDSIRISDVRDGSRAAKAGIKSGDQIVAINGKSLAALAQDERMAELKRLPVTLRVQRGAEIIELTIAKD